MTMIISWSHPICCEVCGGVELVGMSPVRGEKRHYRAGISSRSIRIPCPHCTSGNTLHALVGDDPRGLAP